MNAPAHGVSAGDISYVRKGIAEASKYRHAESSGMSMRPLIRGSRGSIRDVLGPLGGRRMVVEGFMGV